MIVASELWCSQVMFNCLIGARGERSGGGPEEETNAITTGGCFGHIGVVLAAAKKNFWYHKECINPQSSKTFGSLCLQILNTSDTWFHIDKFPSINRHPIDMFSTIQSYVNIFSTWFLHFWSFDSFDINVSNLNFFVKINL